MARSGSSPALPNRHWSDWRSGSTAWQLEREPCQRQHDRGNGPREDHLHEPTMSTDARHRSFTGIPSVTSDASFSASQFVMRTQPRLRASDLRRFRRAVKAEVILVEANPDDADRIVRSGLDRRFGVARIRVPEQIGVVVEDRHVEYAGDLPVADGQRVLPLPTVTGA